MAETSEFTQEELEELSSWVRHVENLDAFQPWEGSDRSARLMRSVADKVHALAALCLHGQPFGFTWTDVDALSRMLDQAERFGAENPYRADTDWWRLIEQARSAKDRLQALLPPRQP